MAFASPADIVMSSPSSSSASTSTTESSSPQSKWDYMTNRRSRKQASLFFLGATLFTFSTILTRRSTFYRHQAAYPLFYKPSNTAAPPVNGQLEALKALQLATFNVVGVMTMLVGGGLWAFDISGIDDLRTRLRRMAPQGWDTVDGVKKADEEFEEWLAVTLARRKAKEEAKAKAAEDEVKKR